MHGKGADGKNLRRREGRHRGKGCMFEVYIHRAAVRGQGRREEFWTLGILLISDCVTSVREMTDENRNYEVGA
jgi:hypothetical protein